MGCTNYELMDLGLSGLHWESCLVYLDDVIVYGSSFSEAKGQTEESDRFRKAGLKVGPNNYSVRV